MLTGGGVGITPTMSLARYLTDTGWPRIIYTIPGSHSPKDYIFRREIEEMQLRNPLQYVATTVSDPQEKGWSGPVGRIDARLLLAKVPDTALHRDYLCGSQMMIALRAARETLGVPAAQVKTETFGTDKRDPTRRSGQSSATVAEVRFDLSGKTALVLEGMTLLEAAEEPKVHIDNVFRSGSCSNCRVKLKSGKVRMEVDEALSDAERKEGCILTCQAMAVGKVVLEA